MKGKTRAVTLSAACTALTLVFLYLASILPTEQLGFIAVASLFGIAAIIESGLAAGIAVFICSALLGALIVPNKPIIFVYILSFGHYPVMKYLAEKLKPALLRWVVKFSVFNAALTAIWFLFRTIIFNGELFDTQTVIIYLAGNIIFLLYDIGLSKLIGFYIARISKYIKNNNR